MSIQSVDIKKTLHFSGHSAAIYTITAGFSNHTILSGAGDGLVAEWEISKHAPAKALAKVAGNIFSICLSPNKKHLCIGTLTGDLFVIDIETNTQLHHLHITANSIFDIQLFNQYILAASGNGDMYVFSTDFTLPTQTVHVGEKNIRCIQQYGNELALASSDGNIYILDAYTFSIKHQLASHTNSVFCACYTKDGSHLMTGSRDAQLKIWDVKNNYRLVKSIAAHLYTINDIKLSPDGKLFATASRDKHIKIWDCETFTLLKVIDKAKYDGHINSVNKLFWSSFNDCLISCGDDRSIMTWQIDYD